MAQDKTVTKGEIVSEIQNKTGLRKCDVEKVLNELVGVVTSSLSDGVPVKLSGFGTFEMKHKKEKLGRNPNTGERIVIPERSIPCFRPGKMLKEATSNS